MSAVQSSTPSPSATSAGGASGAAFVRKSSGLIKSGTPWRVFVMAFAVQGVGAWMALYYLYGVGPFPRANIWLAFLLMLPLTQAFNLALSLLASAYPRDGGDYVFLSRIFSPGVGFITNFGTFCAVCFFASSGAFLLLTVGLAPAMQVFGVVTHHPSWVHGGTWLSATHHAWLVASILVLLFGALVAFGMKIFYRYQAITWWIGGGLFLLLLVVYAVSGHSTFVSGFNRYVLATSHVHNAYAQVIAAAHKSGIPHGYTLYDTLGMFAVATAVSSVATAWIGGEVRTPLRTQLLGGVGGGVAYWIVILIITAILAGTTGLGFNRDATFLAIQHSAAYVPNQSPVFTFYAFLCTTSPVLLFLMMAGIVIIGAYLVPSQILYPTRMLFAWSFDRLAPRQVASVSPRTNAPVVATVITIIACEGLLALYGTGQITFINPVLIFGTICLMASIAALMMPFMPKSRELYRKSMIKREIFGIPVITLAAVFGIVFWVVALYVAFTRDALGANAGSNVRIWIATFIVPTIYYVITKWYRRRQGMDLSATFNELPPE
jgi:basic amino acid/polyamine antiporter, APA family